MPACITEGRRLARQYFLNKVRLSWQSEKKNGETEPYGTVTRFHDVLGFEARYSSTSFIETSSGPFASVKPHQESSGMPPYCFNRRAASPTVLHQGSF